MGMLQSARLINQLITTEVESGTDPSRIVLGGFSQGAAMSLLTGLTGERKLAGVAVLSGWLPLRQKFKAVRGLASYNLWMLYLRDNRHRCRLNTHPPFLSSGVTVPLTHLSSSNFAKTPPNS